MGFAKITGTGVYIPEKILSNKDLESLVDTSDEWIKARTGISERRILDEDKAMYYNYELEEDEFFHSKVISFRMRYFRIFLLILL